MTDFPPKRGTPETRLKILLHLFILVGTFQKPSPAQLGKNYGKKGCH